MYPDDSFVLADGLALYLSPEWLRENDADCSSAWENAIRSPHYFICIDEGSDGDPSLWLPTSSKFRNGRVEFGRYDKIGTRHWVDCQTYCNIEELWTIPRCRVADAAFPDSHPGQNAINRQALIRLQRECCASFAA